MTEEMKIKGFDILLWLWHGLAKRNIIFHNCGRKCVSEWGILEFKGEGKSTLSTDFEVYSKRPFKSCEWDFSKHYSLAHKQEIKVL